MADTDDLSLDQALAPDQPESETGETEAPEAEAPEAEEAAPPAEPEKKSDDEPWHVKAVMSEREKRQAAERERDELRQRLEAQQEAEPKTSVFEDEAKFRSEMLADLERLRQNDRYDISQRLAEDKYGVERVSESLERFKALAEQDPTLSNEVFDDPIPYFKMIEIVERQERAKQVESFDAEAEREKIRAEEIAKLQSEAAQKAAKREGIAPSLASARSSGVGTQTEPDPTEPTVEDFFPD